MLITGRGAGLLKGEPFRSVPLRLIGRVEIKS